VRLLGLDSAFAHTGWCVLGGDGLIAYGVIDTQPDQSDWERIVFLHDRLCNLFVERGVLFQNGARTQVVIEKTDWSRGARSTRADWIKETSAREALAIGVTTAFNVCLEAGVVPVVLGPRDWHRSLAARTKDDVALYAVRVFPDQFTLGYAKTVRGGRPRAGRVVRDHLTGKRVPDHVTDAIGMTLVAQRRWELEQQIQRQTQEMPR
jgi:hypothetical protein